MGLVERSRRRQRWWGRLALGGILAVAVPQAVLVSEGHLRHAAERLHETRDEAYARLFGTEYRARIGEIRQTIPEDALYFLVDGGGSDDGSVVWVRYELAPRRAIALGKVEKLRPAYIRQRARGRAEWVVVARGEGRPPDLVEREAFARGLPVNGARKRTAGDVDP